MTAYYSCGTYYADTKDEAEQEARTKNAGAFTAGERTLIYCVEVKD